MMLGMMCFHDITANRVEVPEIVFLATQCMVDHITDAYIITIGI
jgi:hypothetical protein